MSFVQLDVSLEDKMKIYVECWPVTDSSMKLYW